MGSSAGPLASPPHHTLWEWQEPDGWLRYSVHRCLVCEWEWTAELGERGECPKCEAQASRWKRWMLVW